MRILVLGGYGLIGLGLVRRLISDGHAVTGLGRNPDLGKRLAPNASWIGADLSHLTRPENWQEIIVGFDAIVNASGALQTGGRDNVDAVQNLAIRALIRACETVGIARFVQISAPMANAQANTDFMASKGQADAALTASGLPWTILRPGLVFAHAAYGGTALIRMLAAQPIGGLIAFGDRQVQCVDVDDIAEAVSRAVSTDALNRIDADLVEDTPRSLRDAVTLTRNWLGFPRFRFLLNVPGALSAILTALADLAGLLGWRSPLRSNAVKVLEANVLGDATQTRSALGRPARTLEEVFRRRPAQIQDRWHARLSLLFPILLTLLTAFWAASAAIGVISFEAARDVMPGLPDSLASGLVAAGIAADFAIAAGLAWRKTTRLALMAGIGLTLAYLGAASLIVPQLWLDPLGPLVKSATLIGLHLAVLPMLEER